MDRFEEVVDFLAAYSPSNCSMSARAFEQLKEMMSGYLDLEDLLSQSEMILGRLFSQSKLAFMRAGILIKKDRNLLADLELIEGFIDHIDKTQSTSDLKHKDAENKKEEFERLVKECSLLRSNCESLTQRCSSMHHELSVTSDQLRDFKQKATELEQELERTKSHSTDTIEHFHSLYNTAVKESMTTAKRTSLELSSMTALKDQLEREASNLRLELEENLAAGAATSTRINLVDKELATLKAEYNMVKEKYLKLNDEHSEEIKAYQAEIEELNFKLIEAKKSMKRQDSLNLSVDDHGLDDQILGENFLAEGFGGEDLDRYSQSSTGSRPCKVQVDHAFIKKDKRYSKRNSLVSANQNTTVYNSMPSIIQQRPPEIDKEIVAALKATIEAFKKETDSLKKEVFAKDLEIEELKLLASSSQCQLSEIMNEFTDEILSRDKTIAVIKRELRAAQSSNT